MFWTDFDDTSKRYKGIMITVWIQELLNRFLIIELIRNIGGDGIWNTYVLYKFIFMDLSNAIKWVEALFRYLSSDILYHICVTYIRNLRT